MKQIKTMIIGTTPLLQHRMDEESLFGLMGKKSSKKKDKMLETPRQIASKHAYQRKDGTCFIPAEYIVGAFAHVSGDYKQANSARKSIKSIAKGIFRIVEAEINLLDKHRNQIKNFEIDVRKATNHQKGAVAVCRPRFDDWQAELTIEIDDTLISVETAQMILEDAGKRSGIGSFRVSRGGYFGQFRISEFKEITE